MEAKALGAERERKENTSKRTPTAERPVLCYDRWWWSARVVSVVAGAVRCVETNGEEAGTQSGGVEGAEAAAKLTASYLEKTSKRATRVTRSRPLSTPLLHDGMFALFATTECMLLPLATSLETVAMRS